MSAINQKLDDFVVHVPEVSVRGALAGEKSAKKKVINPIVSTQVKLKPRPIKIKKQDD